MTSEFRVTNIWILLLIGATAGVCNGMIGCGGGVVIVYALSYLYRKDGVITQKDVFATAVASILPMSAVSVIMYITDGTAGDIGGVYKYLLPAVAGGITGAIFLDKIKSRALGRLFAMLVMWAGVSMILRRAGVM